MKMLRWMAAVTRLDRICSEDIRYRFGMAEISDKLRKSHQRWYGHVLRAEERTVCKVSLGLEVPGKRPKGRPGQRWPNTFHADLKLAGIHPDQEHDRAKWRQRTTKADPATKRDKR
ncbi:hypothetical protein ANCDUO_14951 [Ancylostoma duodenale]|uniref:Uncharacterized protein n=1 Tax=Ancylostoma duodenale TaxID=51022 RepID=A0A0C2G1U6_9BILA|nr:hypothetical protein ANCDUO_14951 [Ancylostoma duodenale]